MGGFFGGGGASASDMVGATSSAAGTAGLVPQPAAGEQGHMLYGDAKFKKPFFSAGGSYGTDYVGWPYLQSVSAWNFSTLNVNGGLLMKGKMFYSAGVFNRLALYVSSGSSGKNAKVGIYDIDTNGYESSLVASGTISLASTGVAEVSVSDFTLESKMYVCAWIIDNSGASLYYVSNGATHGRPFSIFDVSNNSNINSSTSHMGGYISRSYADGLPSSLSTTGYTGYNPSVVWVRRV